MTVWAFRATTIFVFVLGAWAVAPYRADRGFLKRLATAIFAVACWRSARQVLIFAPARAARASSSGTDRFDCLRARFAPGTIVGYLGSEKTGEIAVDYGFRPRDRSAQSLAGLLRLVDAEASLAPAVVVNRTDTEYLVVDSGTSPSPPPGTYDRVTYCPTGVVLLHRRAR